MSMLRLALVITNTDRSAFAQAHPNDGEKLRHLLQTIRPQWELRVWDAVLGELPDIQACDGAILTGSPASVNQTEAWMPAFNEWLKAALQDGLPLIGLCYGHQAIAHVLGAPVGPSPQGWSLGYEPTHFQVQETWMQPSAQTLRLYSAHNEQVLQLPPGARLLGGDAHCPIGAYAIGEQVLCSQYHPEMTPDFIAALVEYLADELPASVIERAQKQIEEPAQGAWFAQWMCQFLIQAQAQRGGPDHKKSPHVSV